MKLKKIPKQVVILGMISFFTDFASEMLYPITPLFLTAALGASMATVGVIEGIAEITAGILKGYFGILSDKTGKRSIFVRMGYGISALVKSLPGIFPFVPTVLFSRTMDRVGKGIRTAPRDALLAGHSDGNTGAVFGFHRSMDTFGAVVGPLAALLILFFLPGEYTTIYLIAAVPSLCAIYFTWKVKDPVRDSITKKKNLYKRFWKSAPLRYKHLLILVTLFSFVNSSDVFLILKSKEITESDTIAILGYVFYNFVYAGASYPIGIMADKFGKKNIFVFGLVIFSIVYFSFAQFNYFFLTWILFALYGIYTASTEGVIKAWISDLVVDEFRGSAIGLVTSLSGFAIMIGSVAAGFLWDNFGAEVPFMISSVVSLIIAGVLLIMKK